LSLRKNREREELLAYFNFTAKDLTTRILYQQMTSRVRPKAGPIPAMVNFLMIFLIGEGPDKIREQILKVYEISIDIFQNAVKADLIAQGKSQLLTMPEKVPLVLIEYYQEKIWDTEQSEFLHVTGLTLYPFDDEPLDAKFGADKLKPIKEALDKAILEQGKNWSDSVNFVLPLENTPRTKRYLPILDDLRTLAFEQRATLKL
jgi:hypothetical protein